MPRGAALHERDAEYHHGRAGRHPYRRAPPGQRRSHQGEQQRYGPDDGTEQGRVGTAQRVEYADVEADQPGRCERREAEQIAPARSRPGAQEGREDERGEGVPQRLPGQHGVVEQQPADRERAAQDGHRERAQQHVADGRSVVVYSVGPITTDFGVPMFPLDRSGPALSGQLATALREAVADGRLAAGTRLPASRDLARELGVSRGLVVSVYEQLLAEGRLVARRGSGTYVARDAGSAAPAPVDPPPPATALRPGIPDLGRFPRQLWRRAYERALREATGADLDYGDPCGALRLRVELAGYLARVRAARVAPERLIVTSGAAQALALLARVGPAPAAVRPGGPQSIAVEDPGSAAIREHLRAGGLVPVPVPVDEEGIDVDALVRTGVAVAVVTPAHQFPTGVVLSAARRGALLDWARERGGLIVEDDYDAEFRYDREPVGCLQGRAPELVALVGSLSKSLAPALRLGWLVAPPARAAALRAAKSAADHGSPTLDQLAFAELLASGGYDRHLRAVRRLYRQRRDAALASVARHLPGAHVTGVAAGMHLVVTLPSTVDDQALAERATAHGLGVLALSAARVGTGGPSGLVLGYASCPPDRFASALRDLGRLIR
jgi:GntR family transcriptional regulator/MocR family aminotransferase